MLLSQTVKDLDDFFEGEKNFLIEYYVRLRDCTIRADKMTVVHKSLADNYIKISTGETNLTIISFRHLLFLDEIKLTFLGPTQLLRPIYFPVVFVLCFLRYTATSRNKLSN